MPTLTIHYETETERLAYERAIAFAAELHRLGQDSPAGAVLDSCEAFALERGRQLLRDGLASAVQARVDRDEQKGAPPIACPAAMPGGTRGGGFG